MREVGARLLVDIQELFETPQWRERRQRGLDVDATSPVRVTNPLQRRRRVQRMAGSDRRPTVPTSSPKVTRFSTRSSMSTPR